MKRKTCTAVLLTAVLGLTACGKKTADSPGPAVSSVQMMELNKEPQQNQTERPYGTTYEVFLYSYYDSDGDGIGDINGLRNKLDYIQDMGFDGIWLMPVTPSDTYHKYDVKDYYAVDPAYGTMDDFDALIKECHERNINVYTDLVLNHTADDHPWFQQAWDYLKELPPDWGASADYCPYFSYYNFTREYQNGYAALPDTNWYYEARFWDQMPDLNLDSPAVREEIVNIMKFWLDHGVDGFRLDAVTSYYTGNDEANITFLRWLCEEGRKIRSDCYFVAEAWSLQSDYASYYRSGIDSMFDFAFADSEGIIAKTLKGSYGAEDYVSALVKEQELYSSMNEDYVNAPFYTNHDMGRSTGYYAGDDGRKTKMAGGLNLLMSGNAFVYYGEELGMKGSGKDENKRAPMYWGEEGTEGLCNGPADMDHVEMKFPSYEEQKDDPLSIWNYYRQAVHLRRVFPVIAQGKVIPYEDLSDEETAVMVKEDGKNEPVMIVINTGEETETVSIKDTGYTTLSGVLNTSEEDVVLKDGQLTVPAYDIAVLTK